MKFTEEKLERAVIELFEAEDYKHLTGEQIHKEMPDVLLRDDLKQGKNGVEFRRFFKGFIVLKDAKGGREKMGVVQSFQT